MSSNLFHAPIISPTDEETVAAVSKHLGLDIPEHERKDYTDMANAVLMSSRTIHDLPQPKPEVSFPRGPWYRPRSEENKYNAWFVKTEISGAAEGILRGKRIAIKDNVAVAGVPMMNGSTLLEGHVPDYDATVVTRILKAGGMITGKAVCENLCYAANSFTSHNGPVLNPLDTSRSAGGSSSGCAALLAAGEVDMALGGDQGGSIRMPASSCGVVGLKPTFGLVPFTGSMGLFPPIDHVGPMARDVRHCALLLQAIAGYDEMDFRQHPSLVVPDYLAGIEEEIRGMKIGRVKEGFDNCKDEEVKKIVKHATDLFVELGCTVQDVSVPFHKTSGAIFEHVTYPGVYENLRNGGILIGTQGWQNVDLGDRVKTAFKTRARDLPDSLKMVAVTAEVLKNNDNYKTFAKAVNLVPVLRKAYDDVLDDYDVLVMPTLPNVPPALPKYPLSFKDYMDLSMSYTINTGSFNLTGHPALSVNAGFAEETGMPVGMMIVGRHFQDKTILKVARAFEKARDGK